MDSLAAGFHGETNFEGSFDWSPEFGTSTSVHDTANEQFIVNAPHGVGINTATAPDGTPLRDALALFHRRFPQVPFTVFVTDLLSGQSAMDYAFWLTNRAPSGTVHATGSDSYSLPLVVDASGGHAAFAAGCGLEIVVREE